MLKNISNECTILVSSCDNYSDLWGPYFELKKRFWPDCPFQTILITEEKEPNIKGITPLVIGSGLDWSSLLIKSLEKINTPYVLFTLEDFFLRKNVDTKKINNLLDIFKKNSIDMLRLTPRPGPTQDSNYQEFGIIDLDAPYRVSTQAAIWKVEVLKKLLVPGESAWEFEKNATIRSNTYSGFVSVWEDALPYGHHVVERGKWFPWDYSRLKKMNIGMENSKRPIMSIHESFVWGLRKFLSPLYQYFRLRLRNTGK